MTQQLSEKLLVAPGAAELPRMQLFGVIVGDIDDPKSWSGYQFASKGDPTKITMCTALWRGWVSTYRLKVDGTLSLERLEYPYTDGTAPDQVSETLTGDFWLDLRESFMGASTRVPFVAGHIDPDRSNWRHGPGTSVRLSRRTEQ